MSTGEQFILSPEQNSLQIGLSGSTSSSSSNSKSMSLDVDLSTLAAHAVPLQAGSTVQGVLATIFRVPDVVIDVDEDNAGDDAVEDDNLATFQLMVASAEPVFVNGVECLAANEEATPLNNNAVIELAGLRFCFQCP